MPFRQKSSSGWVRLLYPQGKFWTLKFSWIQCLFLGSNLKFSRWVQSSPCSVILEQGIAVGRVLAFSQLLRADLGAPTEILGPCAVGVWRSRVSSMPSHFENTRPGCTFQLCRWEPAVTDAVLPSCLGTRPLSWSHGDEPGDCLRVSSQRCGCCPES